MAKHTHATNPLTAACPQCDAPAGSKCKNWKGGGCAPHRERWAAASEPSATTPAPLPEPPPEPDQAQDGESSAGCPEQIADILLADIPGFAGYFAKKVYGHGEIRTVGELWAWVDEDGFHDGGMADPHGLGLFGCLAGIGITRARASAFADCFYVWLKEQGCDPRAKREQYGKQTTTPEVRSADGERGETGDGEDRGGAAPGPDALAGSDRDGVLDGVPEVGGRPNRDATVPAIATCDFDETTPPPRCRPRGVPVPAYVTLPPGESAYGHFTDWDKKGRLPDGSVLADFVGKGGSDATASGYRVAAIPEVCAGGRALALGPVGTAIPADKLDAYRIAVTIREGKKTPTVVVLAPMEIKV